MSSESMFKRAVTSLPFLIMIALPGSASATEPPSPEAGDGRPPAAATALDSPTVPDNYKIELLIRTTIIAINQANATGNYTVLRDLASPNFQTANDPARLAEIFASLRGRKLDLSPTLVFSPKLVQPPAINADGRLRLTGFFDTRPERVIFDLLFEKIERNWRLFGVAIEVAPPS